MSDEGKNVDLITVTIAQYLITNNSDVVSSEIELGEDLAVDSFSFVTGSPK